MSLLFAATLSALVTAAADGPLHLACDKGTVDVFLNGRKTVSCTGLLLAFEKKHFFGKGTAAAVPGGFEMTYAPPSDFPADKPVPCAKGVFTCDGESVSVRYTVENAAKDAAFRPNLCMFGRRLEKGLSCTGSAVTDSYWVRDPDGGQPWETALGRIISCTNALGRGFKWVFADGCNPNPQWQDPWHQHLKFRAAESNAWECAFRLFPADGTRSDLALALAAADRPAHVTIRTGKTYNWFDDPAQPLAFTGEIMNAQSGTRRFDVSWHVRGFNGPDMLASGTRRLELAAGAKAALPVSFNPAERRGLYFVELSVRDVASGREAFTRTNLARLPPYRFTATPETSPFGLAAYWPIPDEESVQRLMDRMGVMWIRNGDTRLQHPPRVANHSSGTTALRKLTGAEREKWIIEQFELCRTRGNPHWEFCNEINMATAGIALKSHGIGQALLAPLYADFVRDIYRVQQEKGYTDIKLLTLGLAGCDDAFIKRLHALGVWHCFSGFCLHPGRGNFTPDYPYLRPERYADGATTTDDPTKAEQFSHSNFWNFLGAVRKTQKLIRKQGGMPLWLTEIYTPTFPNSWWEDSLRCSAENTLLTYALIKADGVKCGMYYQLFDTVWYDRLGVNHRDREYYFGLLNRDLSFKPALMAYCAIAEALDGATFLGWLKTDRDTVHALAFQTPHGTHVIAWDRTEGYILNRDHEKAKGKRYRSPEPWEPYWTKSVDFTLPAAGPVTTVNPIGQETPLAPKDGRVTVKLTGAPQIIRGIDRARLAL